MKHQAIPALLVASAEEAEQKLRSLGSPRFVQLDILDQTLVKNRSWADPAFFATRRMPLLELHLMVADPLSHLKRWQRVPSVKRVYWHVEAPIDHATVIAYAKRKGWDVGLAINPDTPLTSLVPWLRSIDSVLVMGVTPGWSGQSLAPRAKKTLEDLHTLAPRLSLAFDGGVTLRNAAGIAKRGAARLCLASALFQTSDPKKTLTRLQTTLNALH